MQSVARLLAFGICLAALHVISSQNNLSPDVLDDTYSKTKRVVDLVWRWVTGVAIIPAALAIVLRLTIPETPRYYADIRKDMGKAIKKALQVYRRQDIEEGPAHEPAGESVNEPVEDIDELSHHDSNSLNEDDHWYRGAWKYLRTTMAGRHLIVISGLWAIMDIGWYGLSMDSPSALSTLWHNPSHSPTKSPSIETKRSAESSCPEFNSWRTDADPSMTVYRVLENNSIRSLLVVSIGSVLGNLALILIIDRFQRKKILVVTFCLLSLLFAITGGSLIGTYRAGSNHLASTIFFGIIHFVFTIGPKTLILIMAVELFPTIYRGTFYGIAAACGKVGAIIIRAIIGRTGNGEMALGVRLIAVIPLMLLGAWMSMLLPDIQHVRIRKGKHNEVGIKELSVVERKGQHEDSHSDEKPGSSEGGEGRAGRAFGRSLFFQKLRNMTLEEIAPIPAYSLASHNQEGQQRAQS